MNSEEILSLESGEEMDALIAENLFNRLVTWNRVFQYLTEEEKKVKVGAFESIPEYSTNISDTWKVVNRLRDEYGLRLHLELHFHDGCYIWLENDMGGNVTGRYEFKNEVEGICKIALLAVMGECA